MVRISRNYVGTVEALDQKGEFESNRCFCWENILEYGIRRKDIFIGERERWLVDTSPLGRMISALTTEVMGWDESERNRSP